MIGDGIVGRTTGDGAASVPVGVTSGDSVELMGRDKGDSFVAAGVGAVVMMTVVKLQVSGQLVMTKHSHGNGNIIVSSPSS